MYALGICVVGSELLPLKKLVGIKPLFIVFNWLFVSPFAAAAFPGDNKRLVNNDNTSSVVELAF